MQQTLLLSILIFFFASSALGQNETPEEVSESNVNQPQTKSIDVVRLGSLETEQYQQRALSEEMKASDVVWLEVQYPETDVSTKVLSLQKQPRTAIPQGAVLLLHDKEQHADWPYLIHPLRTKLPDSGWYTLSVNLPSEIIREVPKRTLPNKTMDTVQLSAALKQNLNSASRGSSKEGLAQEALKSNTEDSEQGGVETTETEAVDKQNEEPVDIDLAEVKKEVTTIPYPVRAGAHIEAAMDHLARVGYQNIIILAYRSAANLALNYIQSRAASITESGFALVMIDPILQPEFQENLSLALGDGFKAPVLDIVNGASLQSRKLALERKSGAVVAKVNRYIQVSLLADDLGGFQKSLLRRIRFWMEKYAPGMIVNGS